MSQNDNKVPRVIKAERVDVYSKRHKVANAGANPNQCYVLITDDKESIYIGEKPLELIEAAPVLAQMDELIARISEAFDNKRERQLENAIANLKAWRESIKE